MALYRALPRSGILPFASIELGLGALIRDLRFLKEGDIAELAPLYAEATARRYRWSSDPEPHLSPKLAELAVAFISFGNDATRVLGATIAELLSDEVALRLDMGSAKNLLDILDRGQWKPGFSTARALLSSALTWPPPRLGERGLPRSSEAGDKAFSPRRRQTSRFRFLSESRGGAFRFSLLW